jgi:DNA polymerase III sliding clamp (beta) subunit (PCNA family)
MIVSEFLNKLTTIRNFTKSTTVTMDRKDDKQSLLFGTLNGTSLVLTVDEELPHATVPLDILIKTMSKLDKTSNVSLSMGDNTLKISHKNKKAKKVSVTEIKCPPSTSIPDLTSTDSTDKAKLINADIANLLLSCIDLVNINDILGVDENSYGVGIISNDDILEVFMEDQYHLAYTKVPNELSIPTWNTVIALDSLVNVLSLVTGDGSEEVNLVFTDERVVAQSDTIHFVAPARQVSTKSARSGCTMLQKMIDQSELPSIAVSSKELTRELLACQIFESSEEVPPLTLKSNGSSIKLELKSSFGAHRSQTPCNGDSFHAEVNSALFYDVLKNSSSETIELGLARNLFYIISDNSLYGFVANRIITEEDADEA